MAPEDCPSSEICELEVDGGRDNEYIDFLWYFNNETGGCRSFKFGGCGGNENRFCSLDECRDTCGGGT